MTARISGRQLARPFGIGSSAVTKLDTEGIISRGADRLFDQISATAAYCRHVRDAASRRGGHQHVEQIYASRARLAETQAVAAELKVAAARKEYLPAAEVQAVRSGFINTARGVLLAVSTRVGARLPHFTRHDVEVIAFEARQAMTVLASGDAEPKPGEVKP